MMRYQGKLSFTLVFVFVLAGALSVVTPSYSQDQSSSPSQSAPDNTANNKGNGPTADQQSNSPADQTVARKIRHTIEVDKSLSTYGHNVKIIVVGGAVTLKGPVHTEDEKSKIGDIAAHVAGGADKVTNNLSVTP